MNKLCKVLYLSVENWYLLGAFRCKYNLRSRENCGVVYLMVNRFNDR